MPLVEKATFIARDIEDGYATNEICDMWVVCDHEKTLADQHSIWVD